MLNAITEPRLVIGQPRGVY